MAYTIKLTTPDGNLSLGNLRGELVTLTPAVADYVNGTGYLIEGIGGTTENTGDVGMYKVLAVVPLNSPGGYLAIWNPTTQSIRVYGVEAAAVGTLYTLTEVPTGTDLSADPMQLLLIGL
jgi:hypothetical protein